MTRNRFQPRRSVAFRPTLEETIMSTSDDQDTAPDETRPLVTPPRVRRNAIITRVRDVSDDDDAAVSSASSTDMAEDLQGPLSPVSPSSSSKRSNNSNRSDQVKDSKAEGLILSVLDHLEDDWDEYTYLDLVPIELRVSLEERLFGWNHLVSSFFGHTLYCVGAFVLAFGAICYFLPSLVWTRRVVGFTAGFSAFRMVRRRRRVWMKHAYGSKAYRRDSMRRLQNVRQADTGWLSQLRRNRQRKRAAKQLRKAETQFQRHHTRQLQRAETTPTSSHDDKLSPRSLQRNRRASRMSFRTDPVAVMESIQQDQIVFASGPIKRMPYSHGGFFAAAPFLLANPHWLSILRHLMPDVYVEISRRVATAPMQQLIHWAENNPVVAAYGSAQELEFDGKISNFEWDVFLDPALVAKVTLVLEQRDKFLDSIGLSVTKPMDKIYLPVDLPDQDKGILKYYNKQLMKRSQELVDRMLIAHGNLTQLIIEQTGYLKHYNYSRVKRTRRTLGGGIYAKQWMSVYAESLRIGVRDDWGNASSPERSPERIMSMGPLEPAFAAMNATIEDAVAVVQNIAKCNHPIGLVLDLKSRHVPKPVWACVVDTLRKAGVRVEAVGSFVNEDVRGVSQYSIKPVTEVLFFHSAGDLQAACHAGQVQPGDSVFFNAGSLLYRPSTQSSIETLRNACFSHFDSEQVKHAYQILPFAKPCSRSEKNATCSTLEHYKMRFNLSIGMYVQEFAIDDAAASILVEHVNRHSTIFDLGLSWGGINGICIRGIRPDRYTSTDGFWNQRYIGLLWNSSHFPPDWSDSLESSLPSIDTLEDPDLDKHDGWEELDETKMLLDERLIELTSR
ncbi:hypothetical protein MPSEU_000640900 [Mayamaea pseudoterrestris]|nr:hypothetical protein MPSEU_000640900 [Mayamaea pseudoterrestris]